MTKDEHDRFVELAGKYEDDAGYTREEAELLARMDIEYERGKDGSRE